MGFPHALGLSGVVDGGHCPKRRLVHPQFGTLRRWQTLLDASLVAVAVGLCLARLEFVALRWHLFAHDLSQVWRWDTVVGGLGWHGGMLGVGGVLWLHPTFRALPRLALAQATLPILPILLYCAWQACEPIGCLAGKEVRSLADFPSGLVSERPNLYGETVPRLDTHRMGQFLAIVLAWGVGVNLLAHRPSTWGHVLGLCGMVGLGDGALAHA
ncbi:MAG UNVERIFIED_CONTAM: prolipoprotein diacylglyceryl transferase [Anaerolineae bacterium]